MSQSRSFSGIPTVALHTTRFLLRNAQGVQSSHPDYQTDNLPVEIILTIGSHVPDIDDRLRLLQVCRRWRVLFLELAYNHVSFEGSQIEPLTKVMLANLRIGAGIRNLSVGWWHSYIDYHPQQRESDDNLQGKAEELVGKISRSPEEQKDWIDPIGAGNQEAWPAVLLASVPNLATLSGRYCVHAPRVTLVVARAARLETLDITSDDTKDVYPHWQILPFFHLPSLRDVNLGAVKEYREWTRLEHPAVASGSGTAPVEPLILESHSNGRKGMAEFITWALLTQKHSLEVLHLSDNGDVEGAALDDLSEDEDDDGHEAYDLQNSASCRIFASARDQGESVVLKGILPPSLKSLHMSECSGIHCAVLVPNLQGVLAHHQEKFSTELVPDPQNPGCYLGQIRVAESFRKMLVLVEANV
ncbi:uncharacterized protein P174DRAFT_464700 [Aspergillus novofumigatus IBT 16806]|uniref:F-box domain-containing protein n=1 Tax=Aspergillus novofumigatus (strain IBT 16806) TaxID=1392255 RepID=A0A2I1BUC8_ASPN1|nr:uncharacterized protein P174DRAFT_464700 [Aspergillus novofumigatus IBT 16806]PKX88975.1 hypothetical protein P174DRAFT_464700 [Aspergillus novofumigatus IBT 16806]